MASIKYIKIALFSSWILLFIWLISGTISQAVSPNEVEQTETLSILAGNPDDYVGSETCKACHEKEFKEFSETKHAKLGEVASWKNKVQGCESCHGSGKEHVEAGGDKTKIISFKNKDSKQISETCLTCHAGREEHNNFRRGDHWRNNVGCTDCHSSHGSSHGEFRAGSTTFVNKASKLNASNAMLISNEQQLCLSCHSEVKAHFNKPFRHKVLEGVMKCSDCHNPHGGFETKQTRLAVGSDAACVKCHTDKQGPFVFEHAPIKTEGCSACHTPHGAANPKLLKRNQVRQLCLECHSGITEQLSEGPTGGPHDQRTLLQRNCTACHTAIHGSNANPDFFR
jgi:DmsE family decaheme c-type cytochrome